MTPQPHDAAPLSPQAQDHQEAQRSAANGDPHATTGAGPDSTHAASPPTAAQRYELLGEIARGGMGVIYRATDTVLGREVAVKVLHERFAPDSGVARRFADEARIAAQLQHPAIPPVHDLGTLGDGRPFLAMKLIKGQTLEDLLRTRPEVADQRGRFVAIFEQVCQAIAYAHAHDVGDQIGGAEGAEGSNAPEHPAGDVLLHRRIRNRRPESHAPSGGPVANRRRGAAGRHCPGLGQNACPDAECEAGAGFARRSLAIYSSSRRSSGAAQTGVGLHQGAG
jgi:hypothetical protein